MNAGRISGLAGALLAAAGAAVAIVSLSWPFGWDQAVFAWVGDTVLEGGLPYRDAFDVKGPLTYLPFILGQAIFGRTAWPVRAFDLLALAGALLAVRGAWLRLGLSSFPVVGGLIVVWFFTAGFWNTAQPDGWAALAITAALCPFVGRTDVPGRALCAGCGILLAAAVLLKPTYLVFGLIPAAAILTNRQLALRDRRSLVLLGAGGFVVLAGAVGGGFLLRGGLREYLSTYVAMNTASALAAGYSPMGSIDAFLDHFLGQGRMLLAIPAAAAGAFALAERRRSDSVLLVLWLALAMAVAAVMGRWQGYDVHALHMPLAILAAIGLLSTGLPTPAAFRVLTGTYLLLFAVVSARGVAEPVGGWLRWKLGAWSDEQYATLFDRAWMGFSHRNSAYVARYVEMRTSPEDRVLALENPLINYLADRASPGRYLSPGPVWADSQPSAADARRTEFHASLVNGRPKQIVVGPPVMMADSPADGLPAGPLVPPEFLAELRSNYVLEARCGAYLIYGRRPRGSPATGPEAGSVVGSRDTPCASLVAGGQRGEASPALPPRSGAGL